MKLPVSDDFNDEQKKIFMTPLEKNLLVCGPPGTGKTVMALYRAMMITKTNEGLKFWVIMYNRLLRKYTEDNLESTGVVARIRTYHQWLCTWGRNWGIGNITGYEYKRYVYNWNKIRKRLIEKKVNHRRAIKFDHLIIDEGQDFAPEFYALMMLIKTIGLSFNKSIVLTIFADENQQINENNSDLDTIKEEMKFFEGNVKTLKTNYRNTKQVAELAAHFYVGLQTGKPNLPDKDSPLDPTLTAFTNIRDEAEQITNFAIQNKDLTFGVIVETIQIRNELYSLLEMNLKDTDIILQTYDSTFTCEDIKKIQLEKAGTITIICGASCKGLEFDAVFIPRLEKFSLDPSNIDVFKMKMYVQISRARDYLFISYVNRGNDEPKILDYFPKSLVDRKKTAKTRASSGHVHTKDAKPFVPEKTNTNKATPVSDGKSDVEVNGFIISHYKNAILVVGNTYPIKEKLKKMGAKWFYNGKCWMFSAKRKNEVIAFLENLQ
ncbi:MAG: hypothetical protein CMI55_03325 [Parcubacteria group bacterium]|nr:hypothetical protein [Parcubacteria group bacterium]|tara:strand:+ start:1093 stop:2565 length:1473 start_codon:yes stop_codon:yes gene_type:complete